MRESAISFEKSALSNFFSESTVLISSNKFSNDSFIHVT